MVVHNESSLLPAYQQVADVLTPLNLAVSVSEMHGLICGYLCAGSGQDGESYIRSVLSRFPKETTRAALMCLFELFTVSQQQIQSGEFSFYLLLPDDNEALQTRAQAFSEWCEGFTQGITLAGIGFDDLYEEESQEVLSHIQEFAELDYDGLSIGESDEKAFMEVSEYTRMAVLRLHDDLQQVHGEKGQQTH